MEGKLYHTTTDLKIHKAVTKSTSTDINCVKDTIVFYDCNVSVI
jgi:hypothetical protein